MKLHQVALALACISCVAVVTACSSSSTDGTTTGGATDGGGTGNGDGGGGGGGGGKCALNYGMYKTHETAMPNGDGGAASCMAQPDGTFDYEPAEAGAGADAGAAGDAGTNPCTSSIDTATCTITIDCTTNSGGVMSTSHTVTKINSDGNGETSTTSDTVTSGGMVVLDCTTTTTFSK